MPRDVVKAASMDVCCREGIDAKCADQEDATPPRARKGRDFQVQDSSTVQVFFEKGWRNKFKWHWWEGDTEVRIIGNILAPPKPKWTLPHRLKSIHTSILKQKTETNMYKLYVYM